ncbi:MAG: O-antigen ligase family protein [Clostridia bacterium]|nr:O-antigen ligase family protein [Clostridia bacterium]
MTENKFLNYIKSGYRHYENAIKKFVYTDYYLILLCVCVFFGWYFKCAPFGITAAVVLACITLLGADDILPLTVNLFTAVLLVYSYNFADYTYLWPLAIPLAICLAVFMIKNGRHKFHTGKMLIPLMAVAYAMLIGGSGYTTKQEFFNALPDFVLLGLGVPAVYTLYNHFLKRDENRDIPLYFSKTMMYIGLVMCLQLLVVIIKSKQPVCEWYDIVWDVGWANRNGLATYMIFTAGMTTYLSTRYRQGWVFLAIGLFQYLCLIMTFSRGAIIFGVISGIAAFAFTLIKAPNKKLHILYIAFIALACLIIYVVLHKDINAMLSALLNRGMGDSGRFDLYIEAWELFKANPIFGVGKGYVGTGTPTNEIGIYWFHSTFFQVIACMGIIGLIAYVYYYWARLKILFSNINRSFNLFVLAVWIGFEGYSLINTGTFVAYPCMALVITMTLLLERTQKDFSGYVTPYNCVTPFGKKIAQAGGYKAYKKIKRDKIEK